MNVQELVTTIQDDFFPEMSRPVILKKLERVVKALFNQDGAQCVFYNGSDPKFPFVYLNTTAGTLRYTIDSTTLVDSTGAAISLTVNGTTVKPRKIKQVFISTTALRTGQYNPKFRGTDLKIAGINPFWRGKMYYDQYSSIIGTPTENRNNQGVVWTFMEDPGTHNNFFFIEFYYSHPDLLTESSPLLLDADKWEQALIDGTVGYIEDVQHGESDRLQKFEKVWKQRFLDEQNDGAKMRTPYQIPIREMG